MVIVKAAGVTRVRVFGGKEGSKSTTRREERTGGSVWVAACWHVTVTASSDFLSDG